MKICKVLCPEAYLVLKISLSEHYFTLKIIYYFYIFFKIFIYFWLYWILVAAHRLSLAVVHGRFLVAASIVGGRRQWHPTPVLLPGKSHGQRRLVCCSPWGC